MHEDRQTLLAAKSKVGDFRRQPPGTIRRGNELVLAARFAAWLRYNEGMTRCTVRHTRPAHVPALQVCLLTLVVCFAFASSGAAEEASSHPPRVNEESRKFWAFQPPVSPAPANTRSSNPSELLDEWISEQLAANGLQPNGPAPPHALVRRACYDLIGLPPTDEQIRRVSEAGDEAAAFAKLVDELLDSPHYGEKWGRHWLDLVRYAETNSYERDADKPNAWRYRDYVIAAFNDDKPYDQFVREQLAGDEMEPRTAERLIATGFYRLGVWDDEPVSHEQAWFDDLDDMLTTTCQTFLGLTINCARCHDHKLDPIPQKDYYRMLAFFAGVTRYGGPHRGRDLRFSQVAMAPPEVIADHQAAKQQFDTQMENLNQQLSAKEMEFTQKLPGGERDDFQYDENRLRILRKNVPDLISADELAGYETLRGQRDELKRNAPASLETALAVTEVGMQPRAMHVLNRGSPQAPGEEVEPGIPLVLQTDDTIINSQPKESTSGRRTALASWIANPKNPLTARVMVNRIWQHHFGRGLVATSSDFGFAGQKPTHPQLLDWLATEFVRSGWSVKHMHRLLMNSATYRRSSADNPQAMAVDAENRLLWRFSMRRLSAEEIRDSILAVNGSLNRRMGGPSIYPEIPDEVKAGQSIPGQGWGKSTPNESSRRSIYVFVKRSLALPIIASFDGADTDFTCPIRFATTQPTQSLSMINGKFLRSQAEALRQFVAGEAPSNTLQDQIAFGLQRVMQRQPTPIEVQRGIRLVEQLMQDEGMSEEEAMGAFCTVALNLNEFIYLD